LDAKTKFSENQRGLRLNDTVAAINRANDGSEKFLVGFYQTMVLCKLPGSRSANQQRWWGRGPNSHTTVELIRIELTTSGLQSPRSPS
jgi:hypothetical protein